MRCLLTFLALSICVVTGPALRVRGADLAGGIPPPAPARAPVLSSDDSTPVPVPEPSEKALQFYRSGNLLWCLRVLWEVLVPVLVLFTGLSARIRNRAERIGGKWFFVVVIY